MEIILNAGVPRSNGSHALVLEIPHRQSCGILPSPELLLPGAPSSPGGLIARQGGVSRDSATALLHTTTNAGCPIHGVASSRNGWGSNTSIGNNVPPHDEITIQGDTTIAEAHPMPLTTTSPIALITTPAAAAARIFYETALGLNFVSVA